VRKTVDSGTQAGIHVAVGALVSILATSLNQSSAFSSKSGDAFQYRRRFLHPKLGMDPTI
jgi:hypothetical protein